MSGGYGAGLAVCAASLWTGIVRPLQGAGSFGAAMAWLNDLDGLGLVLLAVPPPALMLLTVLWFEVAVGSVKYLDSGRRRRRTLSTSSGRAPWRCCQRHETNPARGKASSRSRDPKTLPLYLNNSASSSSPTISLKSRAGTRRKTGRTIFMVSAKRRRPPLEAIRVFEAAGRYASFTKAARGLGVTPGAVAHRVRRLEQYLEMELFERRPHGVTLTTSGQSYLTAIQPRLSSLDQTTEQFRAGQTARALRLVSVEAFAEMWLTPRLRPATTTTVPAGTFDTIPVSCDTREVRRTYYMAPALGTWVKYTGERFRGSSRSTAELISYRISGAR